MANKPDGGALTIKEQIIEDPVSGLVFQFAINDKTPECPFRFRVFGNLRYGSNRELLFGPDGDEVGAGTYLGDAPCRASWLKEVT